MTNYEVLDVFGSTFNGWIMLFTSYISIVFAFLVAATLGIDRLNRVLSGIAITLFSMASLFFIVLTNFLGLEVVKQLRDVTAIQFAGLPGSGGTGRMIPYVLDALVSVIMILTYVGSVFFFFYQRSLRRRRILGDE